MRGIARPCIVVCNTKWGYIMTPYECSSIAEAKRYARDLGLAYRIFDKVTGKFICSGWEVE